MTLRVEEAAEIQAIPFRMAQARSWQGVNRRGETRIRVVYSTDREDELSKVLRCPSVTPQFYISPFQVLVGRKAQ